ncbi:MAG: ABC transporter permease subunit [Methanobacteriota archaeon]
MATATGIPKAIVRRMTLATWGKEALKGTLLSAASSGWLLVFLIVPMGIIVFFGFATVSETTLTVVYDHLTLDNYLDALSPFSPVLPLTAWTIFVSAVAAVGSLLVGYPVAYYLARIASEKNRGLLLSLVIVPFWISFVVQVYALYPWVVREGYVGDVLDGIGLVGVADWLFGTFGFGTPNIVPLVLVWIWVPFMILPLTTSLMRVDPDLLDAAHDLGAGLTKAFWHVTWPLSYPGVVTGSVLVFITAFGSFVEPAFLAGQEGRLIGNFIYLSFLELGNLPAGAAASVVVLVATVIVLYVYMAYAEGVGTEFRNATWLGRLAGRIRRALGRALARRPRPTSAPDGGRGEREGRGPLERRFDRLLERHGRRILAGFTVLVFATFYVPLGQVVIFSFGNNPVPIDWGGFTLKWYYSDIGTGQGSSERALFSDPGMLDALKHSFLIGLAVTAASLVIGIPAALAIVRYRFGVKRLQNMMMYLGLVIPSIVMGVSILVFITLLNDLYLWPYFGAWWETGFLSIIVGHVTFSIPIVIVVLMVSLREFDRSLEEAAMNLGANEWTTFFRVTLPIIKPGVISAALLAFTFSFDELIVTLFLKGQGIETLPVVVWSALAKKIPTPEVNAVSTLILGIAIVFTFLASKVQRGGAMFRF